MRTLLKGSNMTITKVVKSVVSPLLLLLLALVVLECVSVGVIFVHTGRYESAQTLFQPMRARNTFVAQLTSGNGDCAYIDTLFPHPYLGFVQ